MAKPEKKEKKAKKAKGNKSKPIGNYTVLDEKSFKVRLNRVRLSFPHLFRAQAVNDGEPRYGCVLLLDNEDHADTIEFIKAEVLRAAKSIKMNKVPENKSPIRDGEEKDEIDGFEGCHFVSANNKRRPLVLNHEKEPLDEDSNDIYPGCYVNVVIRLWAQDNKYGKRVNAALEGVQWAADGESLGGGSVADQDDFEAA